MQNFTESQTRLAFIQYIFQSEFLNISHNNIEDFQKYFYNLDIAVIGEKKEFKLKFNKNYFKKLTENYIKNFDKINTIITLDKYINLERKFEKWNIVLKSLIFALLSELQLTQEKKIRIIFNDYINIAKSLITKKEIKLMNAIIQKYLDEKKLYK